MLFLSYDGVFYFYFQRIYQNGIKTHSKLFCECFSENILLTNLDITNNHLESRNNSFTCIQQVQRHSVLWGSSSLGHKFLQVWHSPCQDNTFHRYRWYSQTLHPRPWRSGSIQRHTGWAGSFPLGRNFPLDRYSLLRCQSGLDSRPPGYSSNLKMKGKTKTYSKWAQAILQIYIWTIRLSNHLKWKYVATKNKKVCNVIRHDVIWTNKKTESSVYCW